MDWIYGQIVGFLGNFFALMGNMGVELFELEWVSAIILFFSRLAWALFAVSVVVQAPLMFKLRTFLVLLKVTTCCEIRRKRSIAPTSGS